MITTAIILAILLFGIVKEVASLIDRRAKSIKEKRDSKLNK